METDDQFATDPTGRMELASASAGLVLAGRYRLEAMLAHSRQVMSWRAADTVLSRPVLIHLLDPADERIGWVLQAARRAATVTDSRFLRVLDAVEASGQEPWSLVVCEYAVGDSLQTLLADGPLDSVQAAFIVHELAAALAPLHARGLFHLRLSPDSVIITSNGNVKIVGFLIDAALRPQAGEEQLGWSDQEAIDVAALGRLLYAITTGRWPLAPSEPQRVTWGLQPAPLRSGMGEGGAEQVWPAPHELTPGVDRELSAITMAVLRPHLGLVGPGLHTADDVADSLDGHPGVLEAEESLEALVRDRHGLTASPLPPAVRPRAQGWSRGGRQSGVPSRTTAEVTRSGAPRTVGPEPVEEPSEPTEPSRPLGFGDPTDPEVALADPERTQLSSPFDFDQDTDPTGRVASRPVTSRSEPPPARAPRVATSAGPRPVPAPPRQPQRPPVSTLGRRWLLVLIGFVVVALIALQVNSCRNSATEDGANGQSTTATAPEPEPVEIIESFDFDPIADGGDQNENASQAALASDGDPATVWRTLTYLNNPVFGGLKPGVGMVFDLGSETPVASVSVLFENQPQPVQLMVPIEADPAADRPPMDTVGQWQIIATEPAAGLEATLSPETPVTTRWVMVYFTELPPISASEYRSGIAEAYINR